MHCENRTDSKSLPAHGTNYARYSGMKKEPSRRLTIEVIPITCDPVQGKSRIRAMEFSLGPAQDTASKAQPKEAPHTSLAHYPAFFGQWGPIPLFRFPG